MAGRLILGAALFATAALGVPAPQEHTNTASTNPTAGTDAPPSTGEVVNAGAAASPTASALGGAASHLYHSPAWLPHGWNLRPSMSQQHTNGNSKLGLPNAPRLPPWLSDGPLPQGFPWGRKTAGNTNPYTVRYIIVFSVTLEGDLTARRVHQTLGLRDITTSPSPSRQSLLMGWRGRVML